MKNNYRTREQIAMRLELESYKGNHALEELYLYMLKNQAEANILTITKDLERVRSNMHYLEDCIKKMPERERTFLYDVYINSDIEVSQVMKKYNLTRSAYHRYIDKVVYAFALLEE